MQQQQPRHVHIELAGTSHTTPLRWSIPWVGGVGVSGIPSKEGVAYILAGAALGGALYYLMKGKRKR